MNKNLNETNIPQNTVSTATKQTTETVIHISKYCKLVTHLSLPSGSSLMDGECVLRKHTFEEKKNGRFRSGLYCVLHLEVYLIGFTRIPRR